MSDRHSLDRAHRATPDEFDLRIAAEITARVTFLARHPDGIERRLRELDEEWDLDRALQAKAGAIVAAAGALAVLTGRRRWALLAALAGGCLFQHASGGGGVPLNVLREMGYRTAGEIATERAALKALRGDFGTLGPDPRDHDTLAAHALMAARL